VRASLQGVVREAGIAPLLTSVMILMFLGKLEEHFNNRDFHSTEVFALFAAYFFSRTLVPTLVMYLMKKEVEKYQHPERERSGGIFSRKACAE
jgi:multidrug efflux pump subunit AcrB